MSGWARFFRKVPAPPASKTAAQTTGSQAEDRALSLLQAAGLVCIHRNWRCPRGELDLVMREGDTLVIVEVRARGSTRYGGAAASVGVQKQRRLIAATQQFLQAFPHYAQAPLRFDVLSFEQDDAPSWLKAAFDGDA